MIFENKHTQICDINLQKGVDVNVGTVSETFHRVGYLLQLQHQLYGNQWIYTEFDAFSQSPSDICVLPGGKNFKQIVHNLQISDHTGRNSYHQIGGHIEFTRKNYYHIEGYFDTNDELLNDGTYGCMQVHLYDDVLWAINDLNRFGDIGVGNNTLGNKDWTFSNNGSDYTIKRLRIFTVHLDIISDSVNIKPLGLAHGETPFWNDKLNKWDTVHISFDRTCPLNEPNFIIALTGQSNSQGCNSYYDESVEDDQPHNRIYGFNSTRNKWEIADLRTESTGSFWHKPPNSQCLAFHFAKRLVEAYPDIRPGIINLGIGGQSIARWAKFPQDSHHHMFNVNRWFKQGDIYDMHTHDINTAMNKIHKSTIDVICWHQGESDFDVSYDYYRDSIYQVMKQYRGLKWCNEFTPFIVGETTGFYYGDNNGWEKQNKILNELNYDANPYTKCIASKDLKPLNDDGIHFSAQGQRTMGTRYYKAFKSVFDKR